MALNNSFHFEGEVTKAEDPVKAGDLTAYKFVLEVERDGSDPTSYDLLDVYAFGTEDYDPWADVTEHLSVAIDGEIRQDKGGGSKNIGKAVRLVTQVVRSFEDEGGTTVIEAKERENRILREKMD